MKRLHPLSVSWLLIAVAASAGPVALEVPAEPPLVETWSVEEVWRLDNETDPDLPLMGVIAAGEVADDGHVFLMDRQLAQVLEIAPDGSFVRTLGRAGEGPGELEQPITLFLPSDGRIGLLQVFPGKVAYLNRDGSPAGGFALSRGSNPILLRYRERGDRRVAAVRTLEFQKAGVRENVFSLQSCDAEGNELRVYRRGTWTVRSDPPTVDERGSWFPSATWDLQADGTLVVAPERDEYRLEWIAPDGVYIRYDVFGPDGEFQREVRVACAVDRDKDYWGLLRDGTFLHYVNAASALDAMYAEVEERTADPGAADSEPDYLVVRHLRRAP